MPEANSGENAFCADNYAIAEDKSSLFHLHFNPLSTLYCSVIKTELQTVLLLLMLLLPSSVKDVVLNNPRIPATCRPKCN